MLFMTIEAVLADLQTNGVEPFTWQFMFKKNHAEIRNGVLLDGQERRTLLTGLIERIDDDRRAHIFPGIFDLGNRTTANEAYTKRDLAKELSNEFTSTNAISVPVNPSKAFKHIDPWIESITGQSVELHMTRNSLKTLKVIKLFYRVMKQRRNAVFRLIRSAYQVTEPSMEHRDRHPLHGNEEQVWLLADLQAYLRVELSNERAHQIDQFFDSLLPHLEEVVNNIVGRLNLRYDTNAAAMEETINELIVAAFKNLDSIAPIEHSPTSFLDEHMYIHLRSLEFLNYVGEYTQIVAKTTPETLIVSISSEIDMIRDKVARITKGSYSGGPIAPLTDASSVYKKWREDFIPIIVKATGIPIDKTEYEQLAKPAEELLYRYFLFHWGYPDPTAHSLGIFEFLAASCAVWHEMNFKTEYHPYWFGQLPQGRMILSALETPLKACGHLASESCPEAINQIWVHRYRWMADAIKGNQKVNSLKTTVCLAILQRLAAAMRSKEIDALEEALPTLPRFAKAVLSVAT